MGIVRSFPEHISTGDATLLEIGNEDREKHDVWVFALSIGWMLMPLTEIKDSGNRWVLFASIELELPLGHPKRAFH